MGSRQATTKRPSCAAGAQHRRVGAATLSADEEDGARGDRTALIRPYCRTFSDVLDRGVVAGVSWSVQRPAARAPGTSQNLEWRHVPIQPAPVSCRTVAMNLRIGPVRSGTRKETAGTEFARGCSRMRGKLASRKGFRASGQRLFDSRRLHFYQYLQELVA